MFNCWHVIAKRPTIWWRDYVSLLKDLGWTVIMCNTGYFTYFQLDYYMHEECVDQCDEIEMLELLNMCWKVETSVHPLEAPSHPLPGSYGYLTQSSVCSSYCEQRVSRFSPVLYLSACMGGISCRRVQRKVVYLPHKITGHHWKCHIAQCRLVLKKWYGRLWTGIETCRQLHSVDSRQASRYPTEDIHTAVNPLFQ